MTLNSQLPGLKNKDVIFENEDVIIRVTLDGWNFNLSKFFISGSEITVPMFSLYNYDLSNFRSRSS